MAANLPKPILANKSKKLPGFHKNMKRTFIVVLALALAGCATRQPSGSHPPTYAGATDEFNKPPFVGMTKAQIDRLIWRVQ